MNERRRVFFRGGGKLWRRRRRRGEKSYSGYSPSSFLPCIMREADFLGRSNNGEKEGTFFGCFIGFGFGGAWEPHRQAKPMQTVRKRKRRAGMFDRIPPPFLQPKVPSKVPRKFCKTFLIPIVLIPAYQSEIYSVACSEPLSSEKHAINVLHARPYFPFLFECI